jgi:hypothetical protein
VKTFNVQRSTFNISEEHQVSHQHNRWQGFVAGMVGGIVGLLAMRFYWDEIAPLLQPEEEEQVSGSDAYGTTLDLDDISLVGRRYRGDEPATEALGRLLYQRFTRQEPQTETKELLGQLIHWSYGILQGGLYGAIYTPDAGADPTDGLIYASGLWLFGDELAVPLLGLQSGPTAAPPEQHLNRWGAHLAYGLGTAATTHLLRRLL